MQSKCKMGVPNVHVCCRSILFVITDFPLFLSHENVDPYLGSKVNEFDDGKNFHSSAAVMCRHCSFFRRTPSC